MRIPKDLFVYSFKDFCIRCEDIYEFFWDKYAPFNDIVEYREYLLEKPFFSKNKYRQEMFAGYCWEFLMGDLDKQQLYDICWTVGRKM